MRLDLGGLGAPMRKRREKAEDRTRHKTATLLNNMNMVY